MATSGIDRTLKIWDLRTFKVLQSYKIGAGANNLAYSQRGLLAAGIGNVVEVCRLLFLFFSLNLPRDPISVLSGVPVNVTMYSKSVGQVCLCVFNKIGIYCRVNL